MEPSVRAFRFTLGAVLALAGTLVVVGLLPVGWRGAMLLAGLAGVAALGITGGLAGRRALQQGTVHTGRTILVSIVGLSLGVTAALIAGLASLSLVL